jgi:hypothetical protein
MRTLFFRHYHSKMPDDNLLIEKMVSVIYRTIDKERRKLFPMLQSDPILNPGDFAAVEIG